MAETTGTRKLNIGLIGLGRLGRVYARDLATRIPCARLAAVADLSQPAMDAVVREFDVPLSSVDPERIINDRSVDAVVIVTPTDTHGTVTKAAAAAGKAIFCEKPLAISLDDALEMKRVVEASGVFFQLGFMRRFDRGYVAAKARLGEGAIGDAVVFKSSSRRSVSAIGGLRQPEDERRPDHRYGHPRLRSRPMVHGRGRQRPGRRRRTRLPELGAVGDIDNAIITMTFKSGRLGVVDLTRNGIYGYDIMTDLLGTAGTLRIGYLRETPLMVMTKGSVAHDTVPFFMERFGEAYTTQLENFAQNVLQGRKPPITVDDGVEVLKIAIAATKARETGQSVTV